MAHDDLNRFFTQSLRDGDADIIKWINKENKRQEDGIELIASENIVSQAVLEAAGSILTNKYAEGYPGKRYYGGCEYVDQVETIAIERVKQIFGCGFANVQPHSGSQANQAVFLALLKPGDTILSMDLSSGGHLTHGAKPNLSGKWFNPIGYTVRQDDGLIDYDNVRALAHEHKPALIIAGASAYARVIDFKKFREIADEVGAYLLVDMAHISGLVAVGLHPSPVGIADVITSTTHKTLRCGRGGLILTNDEALAKKCNSAIFPGLQGGPILHQIAAKAVGFGEALRPEFKDYIQQVLDNAKILAKTLQDGGLDIVSNGTDTHLMLVDLRPMGLTGNIAELALEHAGMTCNKNGVPFDPEKPTVTSGVRLGTPAATTRGFKQDEFVLVGEYILEVLQGLQKNGADGNHQCEESVKSKVMALCQQYPLYNRS